VLHFPILSIMIWLPILGALAIIFFTHKDHSAGKAKAIALITSLLVCALCIPLWMHFDLHVASMQYTESYTWIAPLHIQYALGVDGIALPMVLLTCFTTLVVILSSWSTAHHKIAYYLATFLVMQGMVIGVFCATDAILFYVFWEAMLIPMYLSIGIWGGARRSYAAIKFFLFTFFGSALLLVGLIYCGIQARTFDIQSFYHLPLMMSVQVWFFIACFFAFGIKVPMWPLHTWLPDAHTEAPAGGSVVLAALMLKMGAYGFLRFLLPIAPDASQYFAPLMIALSLIAIVYVGFIALAQTDMKKLIAYSSVAHMGFVTLGIFMIYSIMKTGNLFDVRMSMEGAMMQMVTHAFGSGAMFVAFGLLYDRLHTRMISSFGGIAKVMPWFATFFMVFAMSNVGLPGTSGFVGEFLVLLACFKASFWITFIAATTLVVGAAYTLLMVKRVFFGPVVHQAVADLKSKPMQPSDFLTFGLLAFAVLFVGIYPEPLIQIFHSSVDQLVQLAMVHKIEGPFA
jgi:NADH-quinone oxidoreductase subunit M